MVLVYYILPTPWTPIGCELSRREPYLGPLGKKKRREQISRGENAGPVLVFFLRTVYNMTEPVLITHGFHQA
jgi:hypothetical protein